MPAKRAVIMHTMDNVATVVEEAQPGEDVAAMLGSDVINVRATETIPFGFKISLTEIREGEIIRKYGEAIGRANSTIEKGALVHIHNLEGIRARGDLAERGNS